MLRGLGTNCHQVSPAPAAVCYPLQPSPFLSCVLEAGPSYLPFCLWYLAPTSLWIAFPQAADLCAGLPVPEGSAALSFHGIPDTLTDRVCIYQCPLWLVAGRFQDPTVAPCGNQVFVRTCVPSTSGCLFVLTLCAPLSQSQHHHSAIAW